MNLTTKDANKLLWTGFLLSIVANGIKYLSSPSLGAILAFIGGIIFIYGCVLYAQSKGYAWYVGLLGIFSLLGLIILYFLPNKTLKKK